MSILRPQIIIYITSRRRPTSTISTRRLSGVAAMFRIPMSVRPNTTYFWEMNPRLDADFHN